MTGALFDSQMSMTEGKEAAVEDCVATVVDMDTPLIRTHDDPVTSSASHGSFPPLPLAESSAPHFIEPRLRHPNTTREIEEKTSDETAIESSCFGGVNLSSRHLANILTLLDGPHVQWPTKPFNGSDASGADAVTTVTSNLTGVTSTDRECANSIHSSDDSLPVQVLTEFKHPNYDIHKLQRDLEAVTKERDLLRERELQHAESLNILKQEINTLTLAKISSPLAFSTELEQLRIENELFAAQIVENEVEIREIRTVLECLDTENRQMRNDLEAVRGKVNGEKSKTKVKADPESSAEARSLEHQIKDLEARLTDVERARGVLEASLEKETLLRSEEISTLKCIVQETKSATERILASQSRASESSCEGFEVTMEGHVSSDENCRNEKEQNKEPEGPDCDSARVLGACDCCQFMTRDD